MQRHLFLSLSVALLLIHCTSNYPEGALVINDTDTSYNEDIISVSKRINQDPQNPENYYLRANAFYYQDNFEAAILDFNTALLLNPKNPLYRYRLAETYLEKDSANYLKAYQQLKEAIVLKPDYAEAQYLLAKLLVARQQYPEADGLLKLLENAKDFEIKSKLLKVVALKEQKDTVAASKLIDAILLKDPNNFDATMQKAMFLLNTDLDLSSQYVDKALSIDEFSAEALYTKGFILQRKSKYADAEILYQRVIKISPSHVFAHYNLAVIQALFDNHTAVIDLCGKIIDLDPSNVKALVLRGYAFEQMGNKKAAREDYQAALKISPDYQPAKQYLSELI